MPLERIVQSTSSPLVRMYYDDATVNPDLPTAVGIEDDIAKTFPLITN